MAVNQLKAGAILSYVSIGLNNIVGLIYTPFMLRMLGQNEYGLYSLVASVVAYLTVLDLGFANAIVRYTAKFRAEGKINEQYEMFGMFILLYCAIGILAFLAGLGLYFNVDSLFGDTMTAEDLGKIRIMMLLMVFNIAFTFPMSIWGAIMTAYERFIFPKVINIIRIILNPVVMVILLYMGYKAIAMVVILTLFNIITLCINAWYCKYRLQIKVRFGKFNLIFLKEIFLYSLWIFINAIVDRIYWSSGQFVLGVLRGAQAVAIYAVAIQLQGLYNSFSNSICGVFFPRITSMVVHNQNEDISELFIRVGRLQFYIMALILTGFITFGEKFILLWAGENYQDAYYICIMLFAPLTVPLIQNIGIYIMQARGKVKFRALLYLITASSSLLISIPLAKKYGGIGYAFATMVALTIDHIIIMNYYYYKKMNLNIKKFWKNIFSISYIPIILVGLSWLARKYIIQTSTFEYIILIILYIIIYLISNWIFTMNKYEKNLICSYLKK